MRRSFSRCAGALLFGVLAFNGTVFAATDHVKVIAPVFSQLFLTNMPGNFRPVSERLGSGGAFYIAESVPVGENTAQWTQMISRIGAKGLALNENLTPQFLAINLAHRFDGVCPASFNQLDLGHFQVDGRDAYALVASCGTVRDADGAHSESTLVLEIKGRDDYYTLQWAERGPASTTPVALSESTWRARIQKLQPIKLCPIVPGEAAPYPSCAD